MEGGSCICARHVNIEKAELCLGTLGGGNPFLEPDQDENGNLYAANTFRESETGKIKSVYPVSLYYRMTTENWKIM